MARQFGGYGITNGGAGGAGNDVDGDVEYELVRPRRNRVVVFAMRVVTAVVMTGTVMLGLMWRVADAATVPGSSLTDAAATPTIDVSKLNFAERGYKYLLDNYSPFVIGAVGTFVIHEVAYFGSYVPWFIIDQIPYFRRYKLQPNVVNTWAVHKRCLKRLLAAHLFLQFPLIILFHALMDTINISMDLPLPSLTTLAWQIPVFFAIEDFYFYWVHRLLHHGRWYKYIHKAPHGIAAEYAHPVETVFLGFGTAIGPLLFARHLVTLWVYLVFRLWETVEDHCGYDLPWYMNPTGLIPFWGGANHHDIHHEKFKGNYADVFTIWDTVFGTDWRWRARLKERAEDKRRAAQGLPPLDRSAPQGAGSTTGKAPQARSKGAEASTGTESASDASSTSGSFEGTETPRARRARKRALGKQRPAE